MKDFVDHVNKFGGEPSEEQKKSIESLGELLKSYRGKIKITGIDMETSGFQTGRVSCIGVVGPGPAETCLIEDTLRRAKIPVIQIVSLEQSENDVMKRIMEARVNRVPILRVYEKEHMEGKRFEWPEGYIQYLTADNLVVFDGSFVEKKYRGRGIFKKMVIALLDTLDKGTRVQVPVSNKKLIPFFKRIGFSQVKRIEVWGSPSNCKCFEKTI